MLKPKFLRRYMLLSCFTLVASTKAIMAVDAQAQSHLRRLSAEDTHFDRFEERFLDEIFAKVSLQLEKILPRQRLRLSTDKEKAVSTVFEELNVKSAAGNLFASEQYQKWATRVFPAYENSAEAYEALFRELKNHYDAHELASLILEGRASLETETVAKKYYDLQIKDWVANKKKDLDVFRALKLDTSMDNVFKNPLLKTYVSFARQGFREGFDERSMFDELYTMLEQKFGVADVAEMLGAPNVDLREGSVGFEVKEALFRHVSEEMSDVSLTGVESVFDKYAVVDSSAVSIWLSYAKRSLSQSNYKKLLTGMIDNLLDQRGMKDKALATVIAAAQKDESTRELATNGFKKLFLNWEEQGKTADDVLNILGLEVKKMKAEDIVESPLLETWFAFELRQQADDAKLLVALHKQLSDEQLASMLVIKTGDPEMARRLNRVRNALFIKWQLEGTDEDAAFQRSQLHRAGDKLFAHPALSVWHSYVVKRYGPEYSAKPIVWVVKKYYVDPNLLLPMARTELKLNRHTSAMIIAKMLKLNKFAHSHNLRTSRAR